MLIKKQRWRSKVYTAWVKTLPCAICEAPADDAHHLMGHLAGIMGSKAPDWAVIPVCRTCHEMCHRLPNRDDRLYRWLAETLDRAIDEGVIVLNVQKS